MKKLSRKEMKKVVGGNNAPGGGEGCGCTTDAECGAGKICDMLTLPCGPNKEEKRFCMTNP